MSNLTVYVNDNCTLELPLVVNDDGPSIYVLDLMGRVDWNREVAKTLHKRLVYGSHSDFDIILTAESKAIALAQELASCFNHERYVVLRKSPKLYMQQPITVVGVKSITTRAQQSFYLGSEQKQLLEGKCVCVLDDVLSTGGTMRAILDVAEQVGFDVAVIAVVLTEGEERNGGFEGVPIIKLGHIPLPGTESC